MPILPYESDIHPDTLLESPPANARWWAVQTLAHREKVFMRQLRQRNLAFYGPLIKRTSARSVRASFVPLFPGYVFLCGSDEQRQAALRTGCVFRIMEVLDEPELLNDLRQIRQLIASAAPLSPAPSLLRRRKTRILSGPFAGFEGVVIRRRGKETLHVAVNFLQRGVSVPLEGTAVPSAKEF